MEYLSDEIYQLSNKKSPPFPKVINSIYDKVRINF